MRKCICRSVRRQSAKKDKNKPDDVRQEVCRNRQEVWQEEVLDQCYEESDDVGTRRVHEWWNRTDFRVLPPPRRKADTGRAGASNTTTISNRSKKQGKADIRTNLSRTFSIESMLSYVYRPPPALGNWCFCMSKEKMAISRMIFPPVGIAQPAKSDRAIVFTSYPEGVNRTIRMEGIGEYSVEVQRVLAAV
jgi:hypothetical protein